MAVAELQVMLDLEDKTYHVGTLLQSARELRFQYSTQFIESGLEISPLHLPLSKDVYLNSGFNQRLAYLPSVFSDSLSDGWGNLIMDRWFEAHNMPLNTVSVLDRLAYLGDRAMGAFRYEPQKHVDKINSIVDSTTLDLERLAKESMDLHEGTTADVLNGLMIAGGSPGGARPKVLVGLNQKTDQAVLGTAAIPKGYEHYVVKFRGKKEPLSTGALEYVYSLMAKKAGIHMPDTALLVVGKERFFAIKRFDRVDNQKLHMHTLGGLMHSDFRIPEASYNELFKVTSYLTKDQSQSYEVLRRMAFNVYANNRDDHVHNHSYLMNSKGQWSFSPAYDLMYSQGVNNYHTMDIEGKKNPNSKDLVKVALRYDLKKSKVTEIIEQVQEAVNEFTPLAKKFRVEKKVQREVGRSLDSHLEIDI